MFEPFVRTLSSNLIFKPFSGNTRQSYLKYDLIVLKIDIYILQTLGNSYSVTT